MLIYERIWKAAVVAKFKALPDIYLGGIEENHEEPQPG
jgi:hypothetical protein